MRGIQYRLVLDLAGNDVPARFAASLGNALQGQVIGLGSARRPDDVLWLCVDQLRDLLTGELYRLPGRLAESM